MSSKLDKLQKRLQQILQNNEDNSNQIIKLEDQLEMLRKEKKIIFEKNEKILDKIKKLNKLNIILFIFSNSIKYIVKLYK